MGGLVWVMVGLAVWHFSIFIPDHFYGGVIGAFVGAVIGSLAFGYLISGMTVPGNEDMSILTVLEGVPGAVAGMGVVYLLGLRAERRGSSHGAVPT